MATIMEDTAKAVAEQQADDQAGQALDASAPAPAAVSGGAAAAAPSGGAGAADAAAGLPQGSQRTLQHSLEGKGRIRAVCLQLLVCSR
jgi:hypothetical protein